MKIIIAVSGTDKYFGMPKYYYLLANELSKLKIDIELIIDSDRTDIVKEFTTVKTTTIKPLVNSAISTMLFCWKLNRYLKKTDFDILHTCHVLPYYYLKNKTHKPVVFQPFGNELFTLAGKGINRAYCKVTQPVLKYCGHNSDVLLVEGKFQWNDMVKWYDNESRMRILPVGIDTSKYKHRSPYSNSTFNILSVNSLTKYDNMEMLIEAFKRFYSNHKDATLTIVGSGSEELKLKNMSLGFPIAFFKEITEDRLIELYRTSDCYVSTTFESDMQMGILEAMASGLPVISCNIAVENIRNAMVYVYNGNRYKMSKEGLEEVKQYDFKVIAKQAVEIYKEILR